MTAPAMISEDDHHDFQLWLLRQVEQNGGQLKDTRQLRLNDADVDQQRVLGALNSLQSRQVRRRVKIF